MFACLLHFCARSRDKEISRCLNTYLIMFNLKGVQPQYAQSSMRSLLSTVCCTLLCAQKMKAVWLRGPAYFFLFFSRWLQSNSLRCEPDIVQVWVQVSNATLRLLKAGPSRPRQSHHLGHQGDLTAPRNLGPEPSLTTYIHKTVP